MKNKRTFFAVFLFILLFIMPGLSGMETSEEKTPQSIRNIAAFSRLYGLVRYFYPGDEAAALDWNGFALYGVQQVEKAAGPEELKMRLEELFRPVAPALQVFRTGKTVAFTPESLKPSGKDNLKVISWQHLGVGLGIPDSVYKSTRLNREKSRRSDQNFRAAGNYINAAKYRGNQFRLRGAVKVRAGEGLLWVFAWKGDGSNIFRKDMEKNPIKAGEWGRYEISGELNEETVYVTFGVGMKGEGEILADDIRLSFRKSETDAWEEVAVNSGFEKDQVNGGADGWWIRNDDSEIVVVSDDAAEGEQCLSLRTIPLEKRALFSNRAAIGDYAEKEIGEGLSIVMPIALYGDEEKTYPVADPQELALLQAEIVAVRLQELTATNLHLRCADLAICWNVFQHFFPYFDLLEIDWHAELIRALKSAYSDQTNSDFEKTLQRLTARLKDGHVNAYFRDGSPYYYPPFAVDCIEGKWTVSALAAGEQTGVCPGDIILTLDGIEIEKAVEEQKQYISAATEGYMRWRLPGYLIAGEEGGTIGIDVLREGKRLHFEEIRSQTRGEYYRMSKRKETEKRREISPGIFYIDLDQVSMPEIIEWMPELKRAKAVIFDLRGYPNSNDDVISHLLKEDDKTADWMRIPQVTRPDFEGVTYQNHGWMKKTSKPRLKAKIVFITDGRAISYAESFMGFIEHYKLATIVGEPTAGTNGNVNIIELPGGFSIYWTGMRVVKHDGSQHHGVGILPNVTVHRTLKGVKEGRDEFLEKALEIAKGK